jgi:hypothetical protein
MKHIISTLLFVGLTVTVYSQRTEAEMLQNIYGMEKKAILNEFVKFSSDESQNTFWELYNTYEEKRKVLGNERVQLLDRYVREYLNMPESEMELLLDEVTTMNSDYVKLLNSYVKKIKKKVGVKQAAQFYQIENYLNNAINTSIAEEIPFIGELE